MIKFFKKNLLTCAALFAASLTVNAQVVVDESFTTWSEMNVTAPVDCANPTITSPAGFDTTVTYATGKLTYTLTGCAALPTCTYKGTSTSCVMDGDLGLVQLSKTDGSSFATSAFTKVNTVSLTLAWTGSYRNALLQSSIDNGTSWIMVGDTLRGEKCGQYGATFSNIVVNKNNVRLRIVPTLDYKTQPNVNQVVRIHKFTVDGTLPTGTGVNETSWSESGAALSVTDNSVSFTSSLNGSVSVMSITGAVVAQQEISRNGQASFLMPSTGIYFVRFISNNKVYTKKIMVK